MNAPRLLTLLSLSALAMAAQPTTVAPCDGVNDADDIGNNTLMGGPLVALEWHPTEDLNVMRVEVFTGEASAINQLGIWSDDGTGKPSTPIAWTAPFQTQIQKGWQGADLQMAAAIEGGLTYWVVWDPAGGEQASVPADTASATPVQMWGSYDGDVTGGADWFGPFDEFWKFRVFCESSGC